MKLSDLATVIRSKNAGPFELTFDVLFANHDDFERVVSKRLFIVGLSVMVRERVPTPVGMDLCCRRKRLQAYLVFQSAM